MKNPDPLKRAWRMEARRKALGSDRCFYCGESNLECLELDHPVGRKRDEKFTRPTCRNCHRKLELERDLAGLTRNGQHNRSESAAEQFRSYFLLLAKDQDKIAEVVLSRATSPELIAAALGSTAASLRRKAEEVSALFNPPNFANGSSSGIR